MDFTKFVKIRDEKFGSVVFDTLKEKVYVTNKQGSQILRLLKEGKNQDEIVNSLISLYPSQDQEKIKADILDFIEELRKSNFLKGVTEDESRSK